jgi:hypothetical protein
VRRIACALALLVLLASAALAEPRRVESVGVAPVLKTGATASSPRAAALRAAVARAVESVALALDPALPKPPGGAVKDPTKIAAELASVLGSDPMDYASRYRILEDRGLRPALYAKETGAEKEYVVKVEVMVDADRVAERLRGAGYLASAPATGGSASLRLVLEGVTDYRAYDGVRRLLVERLGARSALPVEFEPGQAVLAVEGGPAAETLAASLQAAAPPELRVVPVAAAPDEVRVQVEYTPPTPPVTPAGPSPTAETAETD